jgi:hypothetical protein
MSRAPAAPLFQPIGRSAAAGAAPVSGPAPVSGAAPVSGVAPVSGRPPANGLPAWPLPAVAVAAASTPLPVADGARTAELRLPIFEQVQRSRWFSTAEPSEPAGRPVSPATWHTQADVGWKAAARAAVPTPARTTHSGLPVRRPGAQLVPGGLPTPAIDVAGVSADDWRDPVKVSEVAAAYSRGLATGRALVRSQVSGRAGPLGGVIVAQQDGGQNP